MSTSILVICVAAGFAGNESPESTLARLRQLIEEFREATSAARSPSDAAALRPGYRARIKEVYSRSNLSELGSLPPDGLYEYVAIAERFGAWEQCLSAINVARKLYKSDKRFVVAEVRVALAMRDFSLAERAFRNARQQFAGDFSVDALSVAFVAGYRETRNHRGFLDHYPEFFSLQLALMELNPAHSSSFPMVIGMIESVENERHVAAEYRHVRVQLMQIVRARIAESARQSRPGELHRLFSVLAYLHRSFDSAVMEKVHSDWLRSLGHRVTITDPHDLTALSDVRQTCLQVSIESCLWKRGVIIRNALLDLHDKIENLASGERENEKAQCVRMVRELLLLAELSADYNSLIGQPVSGMDAEEWSWVGRNSSEGATCEVLVFYPSHTAASVGVVSWLVEIAKRHPTALVTAVFVEQLRGNATSQEDSKTVADSRDLGVSLGKAGFQGRFCFALGEVPVLKQSIRLYPTVVIVDPSGRVKNVIVGHDALRTRLLDWELTDLRRTASEVKFSARSRALGTPARFSMCKRVPRQRLGSRRCDGYSLSRCPLRHFRASSDGGRLRF